MSYKDIPGWFAFEPIYKHYLDRVAKPGDTVVEIGCLFGKSIAYLAEESLKRGLNLRICAVDPWEDTIHWLPPNHPWRLIAQSLGGPYETFICMMQKHSPAALEHIQKDGRILRATSQSALEYFSDGECAMAMVDGDHSYAGCRQDIEAWGAKVKAGGVFAGDDYHPQHFPDVVRAVKDTLGEGNFWVNGTTWVRRDKDVPEISTKERGLQEISDIIDLSLKDWVLCNDVGGQKWIGRLDDDGELDSPLITLCPALEVAPSTLIIPIPVPGNGAAFSVGAMPVTECWPPMHIGAIHRRMIRFASCEKLEEMSEAARKCFLQIIVAGLQKAAPESL